MAVLRAGYLLLGRELQRLLGDLADPVEALVTLEGVDIVVDLGRHLRGGALGQRAGVAALGAQPAPRVDVPAQLVEPRLGRAGGGRRRVVRTVRRDVLDVDQRLEQGVRARAHRDNARQPPTALSETQ